MAATHQIISDIRNASYNGNLATVDGFYQIEASNLGVYRQSLGYYVNPLLIPFTPANAGNCQGIVICLSYTYTTTYTVALQELVGGTTWTTRSSTVYTRATFMPYTASLSGRMYVPFKLTTPYAVTASAGIWRFSITGTAGMYIGTSDSGDSYPTYAVWCDNKVSHVDDDVMVIADPINIDKTFTTGGVLGTNETTAGTSVLICGSMNGLSNNLTCYAPVASYTWTPKGLVTGGNRSAMQFGTPAVPITSANKFKIDFTASPLVGTVHPQIWHNTYYGACKVSIKAYGQIPSYPIATLSADAVTGQAVLATNESTNWVNGDIVFPSKQDISGLGSTTEYTVSGVVGKNVTLTGNLANNNRKAGGHILHKYGYGIEFYGHLSTINYASNFILSGVLLNDHQINISGGDYYGWEDADKTSQYSVTDCMFWATTSYISVKVPPLGFILQRCYGYNTPILTSLNTVYTSTFFSGLSEMYDCVAGSPSTSVLSTNGSGFARLQMERNYIYNGTTTQLAIRDIIDPIVKDNYFWGMNAATAAGCISLYGVLNSGIGVQEFSGNHYNKSSRGLCLGYITNGGNYNIIDLIFKDETFGDEVANTTDVTWGSGSFSNIIMQNCNFSATVDTSNAPYTLPVSRLRFISYDQAVGDDRIYTTYGNFQRTGTGLTDTTTHTVGGYSLRFQPVSLTNRLEWKFNVPTGNILGKTMNIGCYININVANYYLGSTYQLPRLNVTYDNGTTIYCEAGLKTGWQSLNVPFTPTTAYGEITITVSGMTDATGSNAYFYVDDFSVSYPPNTALDLGNLDLWANALPVVPPIALPISAGTVANQVWEELTANHNTTGTTGKKIKGLKNPSYLVNGKIIV